MQRWFLGTRSLSQIFLSKIFISQIFISQIFASKIVRSKIFTFRILYLGYYIYEINISDMTRYLCQFVS